MYYRTSFQAIKILAAILDFGRIRLLRAIPKIVFESWPVIDLNHYMTIIIVIKILKLLMKLSHKMVKLWFLGLQGSCSWGPWGLESLFFPDFWFVYMSIHFAPLSAWIDWKEPSLNIWNLCTAIDLCVLGGHLGFFELPIGEFRCSSRFWHRTPRGNISAKKILVPNLFSVKSYPSSAKLGV